MIIIITFIIMHLSKPEIQGASQADTYTDIPLIKTNKQM